MSKRPYGSGSVELPPGGRTWRARWWYRGIRYVENTGKSERGEALKYMADRIAECRMGLRGPEVSRTRTVGDLFDDLLADYELNDRTSLPQLKSRIALHLRPALGQLRAVDLTTGHVDAYKRLRKRAGASLTSVNRELDHLRSALRLAVEAGYLVRPPKVKLFPVDNVRTGYLEDDKYRALLEALPGYLRALFVVGFHTGCRRGEMLKLTWDRVDFGAKQIFMDSKTTKSRTPRTLPIYGDMQSVLTEAFRERTENWPSSPYVFAHRGRPIVDFRKAWERACAVAGAPGLRFHDLRRTANRNMRRAGIPELVIRRIIGHTTDSMARRYGIVNEVDVRAAGERAEAFLGDGRLERPEVESGRVH